MIERRPFAGLVVSDQGAVKARLHFSPAAMAGTPYRPVEPLIAWDDDEVAPNSGYPARTHRNVEVVTYVRGGAITYQDDLGNTGRAGAREVQATSAGTGIQVSEANLSDATTQLFRITFAPRTSSAKPRWGATHLTSGQHFPRFVALASGDPQDVQALPINADARVLGVHLKTGSVLKHNLQAAGNGYLVSAGGRIVVNGVPIGSRDGCRIIGEPSLTIHAHEDTEIVLVELM